METPLIEYHFFKRTVYTCAAPCLVDDEPTDVPDLLENIQGFVWGLHERGIHKAVVLLTDEEMEYYYQGELITLYEMFGIDVIHFPIADGQVPKSVAMFCSLQKQLVEITKTERLLVHCFGALGRTGLVVSGLIVALGGHPLRAMQMVRAKRAGSIETKAQENFLFEYYSHLEKESK